MNIDLRSLAGFRIALALLLLSQSILLASDFNAFYGTAGVNPVPAWSEPLLRPLLFGVLPLSAVLLLVGSLTRLSTLVCLVSLIVVQNVNTQILQGGDVLLRLLLFWSIFLPLGREWSLDARWRKPAVSRLPRTTSLSTWAFTLQICFVYWFASLLKTDPLWTQNGNALFYALSIEHFTTPLGLDLRQHPGVLRFITRCTPWFELAGPCLLFVPWHRDACRLAAVTLFIGFHLMGMQLLLRIGLFPWVCAATWLAFLPGSFWDWWKVSNKTFPVPKKIKAERKPVRIDKDQRRHQIGRFLDYLGSAFVILTLLDVLVWNIASVRGDDAIAWMERHDIAGTTLGLEQRWNMYAPCPRKTHGWLIAPADLADGTEVDLFTGQPVTWEKPQDIGSYFGDDRWRRYLSNLFDDRDPQSLQTYADYLVGQWNNSHSAGQQVEVVTIIFMKQTTQPDLTITPVEKEALYFHAY